MNKNFKKLLIYGLLLPFALHSCKTERNQGNTALASVEDIAQPLPYIDSVFTSRFTSTAEGQVTGADGAYSIALKDGRSLFLLGDSFINAVKDNKREKLNPPFIHNSFLLLEGWAEKVSPLYKKENGKNRAMAEPEEEGHWYWPGTGFERGGKLYVFMSEFHQKDPTSIWGFEWLNTDLLVYSLPDFKLLKKKTMPFSKENQVHYGHAVLATEEYVYIYGSKMEGQHASAHVARAGYQELFSQWEFFDGTHWGNDPKASRPMTGLDSVEVSEQFNVVKIRDKYVFLTQQRGIGEPDIFTFTSDSPFKNWENKAKIYSTTEKDDARTIYTYNAMIHPQYEKEGRILVSYNVNSLVYDDIFKNASIYQPRFISVPLSIILGEENL